MFITSLILIFLVYYNFRIQQETYVKMRAEGLLNTFKYVAQLAKNNEDIQKIIDSKSQEKDISLLVIASGEGRIIASSQPSFLGKSIDVLPDPEHIKNDLEFALRSRDTRITHNHTKTAEVDLSAPIEFGYLPFSEKSSIGALMIHLTVDEYRKQVLRTTIILALFLLFLLFLGNITYFYMSRKLILVPIEDISRTLDAWQKGDRSAVIPIKNYDEVGIMAETLNILFQTVRDSTRESTNIRYAIDQHASVSIIDTNGIIT